MALLQAQGAMDGAGGHCLSNRQVAQPQCYLASRWCCHGEALKPPGAVQLLCRLLLLSGRLVSH